MPDDDYDEVEAVVRIPKGGRLADSRKTEGWSRGFTAKSSDKGPEHVEIRLTEHESTSTSKPEPEVVYVYESAPRREKTPEERQAELEVVLEFVLNVIKTAQWAKPHLQRLMAERLSPSANSQLERWRRRKFRRGTAAEPTAPTVMTGTEVLLGGQPKAVGETQRADRIRLTRDEARAHIVAMLTAEQFAEKTRRLLANAVISDETQPETSGADLALTAEQTAQMIEAALLVQPDRLDEILEKLDLDDVRGPAGRDIFDDPVHIKRREI
ncbi:hypothetical protein [Cellulomonas iranensis]|uniref:hypothetical protein n=1 Tax=Cellulomonas iranensis TaxID=76862 RepID=UPI003D7C5AC9